MAVSPLLDSFVCMRFFVFIIFGLAYLKINAQSLGGNAVFNFLNQPNCSQASALGGVAISSLNTDVGLTYQNPALLRKSMDYQINTSFNHYLAGIKNISFNSAFYDRKRNLTLGGFINYINYGNILQTDAIGNILGNSLASDYVLQVSLAKQYKENWHVGTSIKYINSNYAQYKSSGLALDFGLNFIDTSNQLQIAFVVKNMGTQLKSYDGLNKEELPFDVQLGVTKKLSKAPLQFSLVAHHLQSQNIFYNDTTYNIQEGNEKFRGSHQTLEKIFSHLILSSQLFLNDKIELTAGYNFLKRQELNVYNAVNGLSGFSFGLGLILKKLQFRYSSGFYQKNMYQHVGLNFSLKTKT